jgi:multiple sugar transport system ATP-binding protein
VNLWLENLTKQFGERAAVEIPALEVREGEFFTFVGPSGCGKSTTLNLIAGLEEPGSGTIRLGERVLNPLPPHQRDIAFVFQSYALYPHRTVFGNLAFPLEMAGVAKAEVKRRVEEAAGLLGLTPLLKKRPAQLSGGERQRVAVGRAIVRQPKLFLFDEPLSNLDAPLRAQMRKELKRLHAQLHTTFLYVTHDQEEALSLSDRIAVMRKGRIQQCGTPAEIYEQPANVFVASFFGSPPINLLDAQVEEREGALWARVSVELALPLGKAVAQAGGRVRVGARPEHVQVSRETRAGGWPMRVTIAELHGSQVHMELEAGELRLSALAHAGANFKAGDTLQVTMDASRVHLFDAANGERLRLA